MREVANSGLQFISLDLANLFLNIFRNLRGLRVSQLRTSVKTALCEKNYKSFDEQISAAHGSVHCSVVGGSMCSLGRRRLSLLSDNEVDPL